jgi:oligoendopeptidase F
MDFTLEDYGIEPVFYDIPYNGLTMGLDRETIKILCNPDDGYTYYRTHFHELGHALHSALKEVDSYILRRESSIFTEGIAEIFGYITSDIKWLTEFYGLDDQLAIKTLQGAIGPKYHYIRQRTAYCLFEYKAYENLDQDMDKLMANIEAETLKCTYDETQRWASNGWYVSYPVYWQNYVLADFVASQVHHHLEENIGSLVSDKEAYNYVIKKYISQGALVPWLDKIKLGTQEKLNSKAIIEDLTKTF